MNRKHLNNFRNLVQRFCPRTCNIVPVDVLIRRKVLQKYCEFLQNENSTNPQRTFREWIHIFDCFLAANNNSEESIAYLNFFDRECERLYNQVANSTNSESLDNVKSKIKAVFVSYDFSNNNCLSLNYANEIFVCNNLIEHAINDNYFFVGLEYKLSSGKSLDIAFSKNGIVTCVEIKSVHNLFVGNQRDEQITNHLIRIVNQKACKKGLQQGANGFIKDDIPYMQTFISLVLTEEYLTIQEHPQAFLDYNNRMQGLGLPCTAVCVRNFNGQYSVRLESIVHC